MEHQDGRSIHFLLKMSQMSNNRSPITLERNALTLQNVALGPVVQNVDSAIHRINHYPVDSAIGFVNVYPLDSDLSGG